MLKNNYEEVYRISLCDPEIVWDEIGKQVVWDTPYESVLKTDESPIANWFVGGKVNMSYNCLDIHVKNGYGEDTAVIYESPTFGISQQITFNELLCLVEHMAGVMINKCGITKGDRVLLYFPVIPQCFIGMLACTRIGALYSVVYGGIPPQTIAARIKHIQPKLILTCNIAHDGNKTVNYKERIDIAIEISNITPKYCIIYNRPNTEPAVMLASRDLDWNEEMKLSLPIGSIPLESNHPMLIIYTSGTSGQLKGLVMTTGNSVVSDKYMMKYLKNMKPKECWWILSDFGWLTGQTLMTYGALMERNPTIFYEGKPNLKDVFNIMNKYKVISFFASPTNMRLLRNNSENTNLKLTYKGLRSIGLGGEVVSQDLIDWVSKTFNCLTYNGWGQTELGGPGTSACAGFKRTDYSYSVPTIGINPKIVNSETGKELPIETIGRVLLKTPLPPSMALTLYKDHDRFIKTYFTKYPGFYDTMDCGKLMKNGSLEIHARADDVIQVCSTRICAGAIEEVCLKNSNVLNAVVIAMNDSVTGQVPVAFIKKHEDSIINDKELIESTINLVNNFIGEFSHFRHVFIVPDYPKTINGKITRLSLADMINGNDYYIPPTIENPEIFLEINKILKASGINATLPIDL